MKFMHIQASVNIEKKRLEKMCTCKVTTIVTIKTFKALSVK